MAPRVCLGLLILGSVCHEANGAAAVVAAATQHLSKLQGIDAGAGTPLLALLKELKDDDFLGAQFANKVAAWCKASGAQKVSATQVLRRQIEEGALTARQIALDEERLGSELRLANATSSEKEQQLLDAQATAAFAVAEFTGEQAQMKGTIDAASNAMRLVSAQLQQSARRPVLDAGVANNLLQLPQDKMTDEEKKLMSAYVHDPKSPDPAGAVAMNSDDLLQMLISLHVRLEQDKTDSEKEHTTMTSNLRTLVDHLSASIVETKSQVAAIRMEAAQRKRERTRLDGKIADLSAVVAAVERSGDATEAACAGEAAQQRALGTRIGEESSTLDDLLQQIPTTDSSDWLLNEGSQGTAQAPSFLQVREKMPTAGGNASLARGKQGTASTSALDDIQKFVENPDADDAPSNKVLDPKQHVSKVATENASPTNLVVAQNAKVSDEQRWCASIMRDATTDEAVLARSMKRVKAKLHIVKGTVSEHEQDSSFAREQHKTITELQQQLSKVANEEDSQHARVSRGLGAHLQNLIKLASDVDHLPTSVEQQHGANQLKDLMQQIEKHQSAVQQGHSLFRRQFNAVAAADHVVLRLLADDVKHNGRRLVQLKSEAQFLSSLAHAKDNDAKLGEQYKVLSQEFCSQQHD